MTTLSSLYGKGLVSDVAYPTGWDEETGIAPSKNAVYDEMELRTKASSVVADNKLLRGDGGVRGIQESTVVVDDSGRMINPSQPCFLVHPASEQSNIAVSSEVTVICGTELFDVGNNFASNTFTAPITGKYQLSFIIRINNLDTAASYYRVSIVTSNKTYNSFITRFVGSVDIPVWGISGALVVDMDINDTAYLTLLQNGGTQQSDIPINSYFSGSLIC